MVREHNTENTALTLIWLVVILTFFLLSLLFSQTFFLFFTTHLNFKDFFL